MAVCGGMHVSIRNRLDGDLHAPYLIWDGDKRKLNANDVSNEWNEHNRFVFVRNLISFKMTARKGRHLFFLCSLLKCMFFKLFHYLIMPTTKHLAYLMKFLTECYILFGFECFDSVCNME